jgi:hypothetical protein
MTFFQVAVLALLALNVCITYLMLRRLTIATLTGAFMVARWLNPLRAKTFEQDFENMRAAESVESNDAEHERLSDAIAEADPECPRGRESLIAAAFDAYKECRRVPERYRNLA